MTELKVGAWVLLEPVIVERRCGKPWEVTKMSGNRVYLRHQRSPNSRGEIDPPDEKYVTTGTVRYIFDNEVAAKTLAALDENLTAEFEAAARAMRKEHGALFFAELERQHGSRMRR